MAVLIHHSALHDVVGQWSMHALAAALIAKGFWMLWKEWTHGEEDRDR